MFIRKIKTPQGTDYYHLVESYRDKGKVRQRTLLPLGRVGEGRLESLVEAVKRHSAFETAADLAKQLSVDKTFILGPLLILERLFETLGINEALEELPKNKRTKFDIKKILFTLVASRFAEPGSKLKVFERRRKAFYPGLSDPNLKLHQIYRALDFLAKHKDSIERSLFWRGRDLFTLHADVVLYDLTTIRFESVRTDLGKLRQFGYSKEKRSDRTQAVLGLLAEKSGLPLGFEVFPGNTFEGVTVSEIAAKARKKFNLKRFIFVGDRGLFSRKNLKVFHGGGEGFILGMKLGSIKSRHEEFYDKSRFQEVSPGLFVYETEYEGKRLVITWSAKRAERDRKVREEVLRKLREKLSAPKVRSRSFVTNGAYKKFIVLEGGKQPVLNEEAVREEEKRDGFFGVITNVKDMSAEELVHHYKGLWVIEDAFGELKGTLKTRPVFHWTDERIKGHLMMCFTAYLCEAALTRSLRERGSKLKSAAAEKGQIKVRPLTAAEALTDLKEVRAVPVRMKGGTVWVRTGIEGNAAEALRAVGARLPKKILKTEGAGMSV